MFGGGKISTLEDLAPGLVNITPRAGDAVVMTEMLAHATLKWKPTNRMRRTLVLRYRPQFKGQPHEMPDSVQERLSPELRELMAPAHYTHVKDIATLDVVTLT